jgi:hypothetical protein
MANYNPDNPDERGYWYDVELTRKVCVCLSVCLSILLIHTHAKLI